MVVLENQSSGETWGPTQAMSQCRCSLCAIILGPPAQLWSGRCFPLLPLWPPIKLFSSLASIYFSLLSLLTIHLAESSYTLKLAWLYLIGGSKAGGSSAFTCHILFKDARMWVSPASHEIFFCSRDGLAELASQPPRLNMLMLKNLLQLVFIKQRVQR